MGHLIQPSHRRESTLIVYYYYFLILTRGYVLLIFREKEGERNIDRLPPIHAQSGIEHTTFFRAWDSASANCATRPGHYSRYFKGMITQRLRKFELLVQCHMYVSEPRVKSRWRALKSVLSPCAVYCQYTQEQVTKEQRMTVYGLDRFPEI